MKRLLRNSVGISIKRRNRIILNVKRNFWRIERLFTLLHLKAFGVRLNRNSDRSVDIPFGYQVAGYYQLAIGRKSPQLIGFRRDNSHHPGSDNNLVPVIRIVELTPAHNGLLSALVLNLDIQIDYGRELFGICFFK